jgi:hypothetical protein
MDGESSGASGTFAIVILLILMLGLAGVIVYLYMTFRTHKDEIEKDLATVDTKVNVNETKIVDESTNRLGNIKYVVDQVNDVNDSIWNTYNAMASSNQVAIDSLASSNVALRGGIDAYFRTSAPTNSTQQKRIWELTSAVDPRLDIIGNVTLTGGMTALDLKPPASGGTVKAVQARFCGTTKGAPCISFPDDQGDTYLTAFTTGKSIILDSPVNVKGDMTLVGADGATTARKITSANGIHFDSTIGIKTDPAADTVLNVGTGTDSTVNVLKAGNVTVTKAGEIKITNATGGAAATISVGSDGKLKVSAPTGMEITGALNVVGAATMNGQAIQTAAAQPQP